MFGVLLRSNSVSFATHLTPSLPYSHNSCISDFMCAPYSTCGPSNQQATSSAFILHEFMKQAAQTSSETLHMFAVC